MATKDYHLFLKQENNGIYNNGTQYTNVNLNALQKSEKYKPLQSDSCLLSSNIQGYRGNDLTLATKKETLWKKRGDVSTMFEKLHVGEKERAAKTNVVENLNSSTLSLHIAAYETAIEEAQNGRKDGRKKSFKNVKSVFNAPTFRDYFDFPRQPNGEETTTPEVMQFKTSQKMKNPSNPQAVTTKLLDVVNEISLLYERKEIDLTEFISRLNGRREEIGYGTSTNVFHCWQKRVGNAESRFINNGMRARDDVDSRIISIQRKFNPNFCTSNLILDQTQNDTTTAEDLEQSIRVPENMAVIENNGYGVRGRRVIMHSSRFDRGRVGRNREILLTEEQRLQAIQAAEAVSIRYQEGSLLSLEEFFRCNRDAYRAWKSVLDACKEKSHNIGSEWTEIDQRIYAIESKMCSDTSEWGPLAYSIQSTIPVVDQSSINMPESSNSPLINVANSTKGSPETHASKRKLVAADTVPPTKRVSTLLNGSNQGRTRTFSTFSVASVPASSHEQSRNPPPSQNSTGQSAEARQTPLSLNLQSSNQQQSTTGSNQAPSNVPNNDSAAASPPPQIQEAQQSHMSKQIVQISTTMKYGAHRFQNFKLASICSGNIPVIQVLLPKNLDTHMCRGISNDLSHLTKTFRPRVTTPANQQSKPQSVVGIRMLAGYSILDMDDDDDKTQKIVCLSADQKPVAVISLPSEFTVYESWVNETLRMIDIPVNYDPIFDFTP